MNTVKIQCLPFWFSASSLHVHFEEALLTQHTNTRPQFNGLNLDFICNNIHNSVQLEKTHYKAVRMSVHTFVAHRSVNALHRNDFFIFFTVLLYPLPLLCLEQLISNQPQVSGGLNWIAISGL